MINELQRKITTQDMRAGQGPALLNRLGINLKPVNGLTCTCGHATGCTCKLAKPAITCDAKRPGIGHPHLIAAVLALRNISDKLDAVEQQHAANQASQGMAQGQAPQDIINAAAAKAAQFQAENYARKVDEGILESHQKRADQAYRQAHGDPSEPGHAQSQQRHDIDNEAHKYAPLDESSGDNRQATTKHPLGKSRMTGDGDFITVEAAKQMFAAHEREQAARRKAFEREAATNRAFRARDRMLMQDVRAQIERGNIERYGK